MGKGIGPTEGTLIAHMERSKRTHLSVQELHDVLSSLTKDQIKASLRRLVQRGTILRTEGVTPVRFHLPKPTKQEHR